MNNCELVGVQNGKISWGNKVKSGATDGEWRKIIKINGYLSDSIEI